MQILPLFALTSSLTMQRPPQQQKPALFDQPGDFFKAFLMTGNQNQSQVGKVFAESFVGIEGVSFFGILRAAGDENPVFFA